MVHDSSVPLVVPRAGPPVQEITVTWTKIMIMYLAIVSCSKAVDNCVPCVSVVQAFKLTQAV